MGVERGKSAVHGVVIYRQGILQRGFVPTQPVGRAFLMPGYIVGGDELFKVVGRLVPRLAEKLTCSRRIALFGYVHAFKATFYNGVARIEFHRVDFMKDKCRSI